MRIQRYSCLCSYRQFMISIHIVSPQAVAEECSQIESANTQRLAVSYPAASASEHSQIESANTQSQQQRKEEEVHASILNVFQGAGFSQREMERKRKKAPKAPSSSEFSSDPQLQSANGIVSYLQASASEHSSDPQLQSANGIVSYLQASVSEHSSDPQLQSANGIVSYLQASASEYSSDPATSGSPPLSQYSSQLRDLPNILLAAAAQDLCLVPSTDPPSRTQVKSLSLTRPNPLLTLF
jgi:hypothetical protein